MDSPRIPNSALRVSRSGKGSALVITLFFVLLLTILILAFTSQVMLERQVAPLHLRHWEAQQIAMMGADQASKTIQQALARLDDPFASTNRPDFFWALAPGRLDLFDLRTPPTNSSSSLPSGTPNRLDSIPLHSGISSNSSDPDLNAKNAENKQPIWQGGPAMRVAWVNVLKNPSDTTPSVTNPIVGRFAFWVDDEGAKVNINTADGTYNYAVQSYGQGTPSAVSLSAFFEAGDSGAPDTNLASTNAARRIAQAGRDIPYASLADIGSRPDQTNWANFFSTNSFNFTTYSRTPDFNLFNEPKFQLFPSNLGAQSWDPATEGVNTVRNQMIHLQPRRSSPASFPYSVASNAFVVRSIYPSPNQLTNAARRNVETFIPGRALSYHWLEFQAPGNYITEFVTSDAKRMANGGTNFVHYDQRLYKAMEQVAGYLVGRDPFANQVTWPFMNDAYHLTGNPTASKYTLRQIDSIVIQTFGLANQAVMGANGDWRPPATAPYGILTNQNKPVREVGGRFPHLVQLLAKFDYAAGQPPHNTTNLNYGTLQGFIRAQHYLPLNPYLPRDTGTINFNMGVGNRFGGSSFSYGFASGGFNLEDWPYNTRGSLVDAANSTNSSEWSKWTDRLLSVKSHSASGVVSESGIDFSGARPTQNDTDSRATAALFTPRGDGTIPGRLFYSPTPGIIRGNSFFQIWQANATGALGNAPLGSFFTLTSWNAGLNDQLPPFPTFYPDANYHTRNQGDSIAELVIEGGLTYRSYDPQTSRISEILPLDALSAPLRGSDVNPNNLPRLQSVPSPIPTLPLHPPGDPIVLDTGANQIKYVVSKVRDPLLNQLTGDWVPKVYDAVPPNTDTKIAHFFTYVPWNEGSHHTPLNTEPEAEWVDMFSIPSAVVQFTGGWINRAPQLTFPSVGQLQYIRTGAMPDDPDVGPGDAKYAGMPFRCLNFGPANTQGKIPDWAMLDLFTVPNAVWTKPSTKFAYATNEVPRLINLTYGGASSGKINLNGSVLFPWATTNADYTRPLPLAAQFNNLRYNTNGTVQTQLVSSTGGSYPYPTSHTAVPNNNTPILNVLPSSWSTLDDGRPVALAEAIAEYIRINGPLSLPGQMCNIPAVNAYGAQIPTSKTNGDSLLPPNDGFYGPGNPSPDNYNRTRNDIVSQSIGNLVTQGNVFSVWTVGQVIQKKASNLNFGEMEPGDQVAGEVRLRVVIERALDLGVDGVPGNSVSPGTDGAIGSYDDPVDPSYHPANPQFVYRILGVYEAH